MAEKFPGYDALDDIDAERPEAPPPTEAPYEGRAIETREPPPAQFTLERWKDIAFEAREEWLIKRILPRRGVAAIYGKPGSLKSFVAVHIALCVALGRGWGGRRVAKASVIYIGAEGAAGLRKRKAGYVKAWKDLPAEVDFALISAAPNLGAAPGDLPALVSAIEREDKEPGLIVIDTLAKAIGAGDENGSGMTAFVASAGALAQRFGCLVLAVHHVGLGEEAQKRLRGHSSLHGAIDALILCERREGENVATLTLQKLKDDASDIRLSARLSRVVVGEDEDGEEASTLIVDEVAEAEAASTTTRSKSVPASRRLLMDVVADALDDHGADFRPFGTTGPKVRAVVDRHIRERYFARVAEKAAPEEDERKLYDRQLKAFNRAIKAALDAKSLIAGDHKGERIIWEP